MQRESLGHSMAYTNDSFVELQQRMYDLLSN